MSKAQLDLVKWVAWATLLGKESAYVETGRAKHFVTATVGSAIYRGWVKQHADITPAVKGVYHLVLAGKPLAILQEIDDWQYGECFDYLDKNKVEYDLDWALCQVKLTVFVTKAKGLR